MNLLLLGAPRTGTTSLWYALSKHNDIAGSIIKEPLNPIYHPYQLIYENPNKYIDYFGDGKIFLDGTPHAYTISKEVLRKIDADLKVLYIIRNPYERIYSYIKIKLMVIENKGMDFVSLDHLDSNSFLYWVINHFPDIIEIRNINEFTEKILYMRLDQIDSNRIFDFLEIDRMNLELEVRNISKYEWEKPQYDKIRKLLEKKFDDMFFKIIMNENIRILQNITKIDMSDWIK